MTAPSQEPAPEKTPAQTSVSFVGIPSGDHESFCWDVSHETFVAITGRKPDQEHDASMFNQGMFRIYPGDLIEGYERKQPLQFSVTIEPASNGNELEDLRAPQSNDN